ncbi:MAG: hypothetical protein WCO94_05740 [Verrucomicrobiota bacterium]
MSELRATLTVNGTNLRAIFDAAGSLLQDQLIAEMSSILRGHGYAVEIPQQWETPRELSARIGIHIGTFSRKIGLSSCPKPYGVIRDKRGIASLRSHSVLDAFLKRPLTHNAKQ